jgi:predicted CXXCH cytochrome family protein
MGDDELSSNPHQADENVPATEEDRLLQQGTYPQRVRVLVMQVAAVLGATLLVLLLMTGGAAEYTSRSQFCSSCHIMEPYYASWEKSPHHDVACIKCHFPPGAGEKVRGKMLGLVQLLKYVTKTASPRLSAEIPDESCLRCHDTRLLSGRVEFHGLPFDHRPHLTQTRRGIKLRCTSCHSQIVQGPHMTVTTSTCFLCHFKDNALNEGLGTCTRCHQIPEKTFDLGGGIKFSHELAYERGVECASCHSDVIRGNGEVPKERCSVCHNRPDDLARINDHVFLHEKHVSEHKIDCLDCHIEVQHSLDPHKFEHAAANCQSCHTNVHSEQIQLLRGEGAKSLPPPHGGMAAVGISCSSCHQEKDTSPGGATVWKASAAVCIQCHDKAAKDRVLAREEQLKGVLSKMETELSRVREAVPTAKLDEAQATQINDRVRNLEDDLKFLRAGNSIHNMHYADSTLRALEQSLRMICRELKIAEPVVELPKKMN